MFKVTLLDGSALTFEDKKTVQEIASSIAISLGKKCLGAIINSTKYLQHDQYVEEDCKIEIVTDRHKEYNTFAKYTAYIVLVNAITNLYGDAQMAKVYTDIENNQFAVSMELDKKLKQEDLKAIEDEANRIISTKVELERATNEDVIGTAFEKHRDHNPYNKEYYDSIGEGKIQISLRRFGKFCFMPKRICLPNVGLIAKIEITGISGEYASGDAAGVQLQKVSAIYGLTLDELKKNKEIIEERKKSDHRYIGKQLEIFTLDPIIGQGLPIWLPNGTILKQEIKNYLKEKEWEYDFIQIETPIIGSAELYKTSGHYDHYRDDMFAPMEMAKEEMFLKPMSCPHHISVYNYKQRSYKELPLRFAEHAIQHRYESSGSLTGLERVRAMELTDSHIFARKDQIKSEFKRCFDLISDVLSTFDIKIDYLSLSLRDPKDKEKFYDDDKMWNDAEKQLEDVLKEIGVEYKSMIGEAAFYGPKLDIQAKTTLGHEITVSTIQLDFLLPKKFDISYIDRDGSLARPVMIHRGLIGTYERFISILLEQSGGVLPLWCSPVQIQIIPINLDAHMDYALELQSAFKIAKMRSFIDVRDERLNYKIRDGQVKKIPFQLVIGDNEANNGAITYRRYGSEVQRTVSIEEFIKKLSVQIKDKAIY